MKKLFFSYLLLVITLFAVNLNATTYPTTSEKNKLFAKFIDKNDKYQQLIKNINSFYVNLKLKNTEIIGNENDSLDKIEAKLTNAENYIRKAVILKAYTSKNKNYAHVALSQYSFQDIKQENLHLEKLYYIKDSFNKYKIIKSLAKGIIVTEYNTDYKGIYIEGAYGEQYAYTPSSYVIQYIGTYTIRNEKGTVNYPKFVLITPITNEKINIPNLENTSYKTVDSVYYADTPYSVPHYSTMEEIKYVLSLNITSLAINLVKLETQFQKDLLPAFNQYVDDNK